MAPNVNITTTVNNYLAPFWVDGVLRDNRFLAELMKSTKKYDGAQMNFPKLNKFLIA